MSTTIYCRPTAKGVHSLFAEVNGSSHFLFSQEYRRGVKEFFADGVSLNRAIDQSYAKNNTAIHHTMDKLIPSLRYIEREYNIEILNKTKEKNRKCKSHND